MYIHSGYTLYTLRMLTHTDMRLVYISYAAFDMQHTTCYYIDMADKTVNKELIERWLSEYEDATNKVNALIKVRNETIIKMYQKGMSVADIARLFKMKHQNVSTLVKKAREELINQFL